MVSTVSFRKDWPQLPLLYSWAQVNKGALGALTCTGTSLQMQLGYGTMVWALHSLELCADESHCWLSSLHSTRSCRTVHLKRSRGYTWKGSTAAVYQLELIERRETYTGHWACTNCGVPAKARERHECEVVQLKASWLCSSCCCRSRQCDGPG